MDREVEFLACLVEIESAYGSSTGPGSQLTVIQPREDHPNYKQTMALISTIQNTVDIRDENRARALEAKKLEQLDNYPDLIITGNLNPVDLCWTRDQLIYIKWLRESWMRLGVYLAWRILGTLDRPEHGVGAFGQVNSDIFEQCKLSAETRYCRYQLALYGYSYTRRLAERKGRNFPFETPFDLFIAFVCQEIQEAQNKVFSTEPTWKTYRYKPKQPGDYSRGYQDQRVKYWRMVLRWLKGKPKPTDKPGEEIEAMLVGTERWIDLMHVAVRENVSRDRELKQKWDAYLSQWKQDGNNTDDANKILWDKGLSYIRDGQGKKVKRVYLQLQGANLAIYTDKGV